MVGIFLMAVDAVTGPFAPHRWRHRVLVVHEAEAASSWIETQLESLRAHRAENVERDIVVWVCRGKACAIDPQAGLDVPGMRLDAHTVRTALRASAPAVFLIDKDGSVLLQRTEPVAPDELHRRVDGL